MSTNPVDAERETHREICRALSIDEETEMQSWRSYIQARDQYDLTGPRKHWMCCALYVACLQELPAVGHPGQVVQGNGVNITNLLSQCNINIQEFFNKMLQWSEIRSLPTRLQLVVKNLYHEFSVSYQTYTLFSEAFLRIFNEANIVPDEPKRNKKSKPNPCSYNKLREFSWLLFLTVKEQHKDQRNDLTTAHDLFVCMMDLIYRNVVDEGRMDLINPNVLSEAGGGSSSITSTNAASEAAARVNILELLCNEYRTLVESVNETNVNIFLPSLLVMVNARDLKATTRVANDSGLTTVMGLVSVSNFEENLKLLNRRYDRIILRCGMLDERIALNSRVSPTQRNRWSAPPRTPLSIKSGQTGVAQNLHRSVGFGPELSTNDAFVVRGTLAQLMKKIRGHNPGQPRDSFLALMQNCTPNPLDTVREHVARMQKRLVEKLTGSEGWNARSAESRFVTIEALYYQLLENMIPWELEKRAKMAASKVIFNLCSNSNFNETLIVCAAEIIFFLRHEQHSFPWILEVFGMEPFQFFNIIEVTVSSNSDIFTSDIVNHLRRIEEQLVDSICWKSSSILWECMEKENYQIPNEKDVEQRAGIAGVTPLKPDSMPNTPNGGARGHAANGSNDSQSISSFSSPQRSSNNDNHPTSTDTRRLNFFFRKMYQVAYVRLCNLCQKLGIDSEEIQKLIWTILEFTITKCSKELMRDRHLDQLLMCAMFVTMRIKKLPNTFKQIMHCYHFQPQANSSIYRSVFIRHENGTSPAEENNGANNGDQQQQQQQGGETERLPVTEMSGTSVQYDREVYGDIIKFYNDIYVRTVHQLAMQYYNTDISQASLLLSPTPKSQVRNIQKSPRQFASGINLYVSTTSNKINSLKDSPNVRVITFSSSPVQSPTTNDRKVRVRKLIESTGLEQQLPSKLSRLDKIHQDRQHQDHESSENE